MTQVSSKGRQIPEKWKLMRECGWVHVTGLMAYSNGNKPWEPQYMITPRHNRSSAYCINNSTSVMYLADGSVWLAPSEAGHPLSTSSVSYSSAFVPCSNGEMLHWRDILERTADPFWNGGPARKTAAASCQQTDLSYVRCPATWEELQAHPVYHQQLARELADTPEDSLSIESFAK